MKVDTLAPSLFPDVLSHAGETYCALLEVGTGLVVLRWPDGHPENPAIVWIDDKATTHGFARLTSFNGEVFVAYRRDQPAPEHVVAVDLTTGKVSDWSVPCWGMHPLAWGMGGMLAVTADLGSVKRVLVANWPDRPRESPLSRDATQAPTGISRITGQKVIFWYEETQEPLFQNRVWAPDITGSVGVTFDDRVMVDILGVRGQVLSGHAYKAPRIAREGNGAYTVASHREGSHGPTGVEIVTGITQADLHIPAEELPPVEKVPLLGRVFGVCCYCFGDADSLGNLTLPIRPTETAWDQPIVLPSDRPELASGNEVWAVYAGENAGLTYEAAITHARPLANALHRGLLGYKDSYPLPDSSLITRDDVAGCLLKRDATESIANFKARCRAANSDWPSIHLVDTDVRACETFDAACAVAAEGYWSGFSLFAIGRAGVPTDALAPRIARFMSGITGTPAARVIAPLPDPPDDEDLEPDEPVPQEPAMPYIGKPIQLIDFKVIEEPRDHGFVALKKPNGKYLGLDSGGNFHERNEAHGGDEVFLPDGNVYVAPDRGGKTFIVGRFGA